MKARVWPTDIIGSLDMPAVNDDRQHEIAPRALKLGPRLLHPTATTLSTGLANLAEAIWPG